MEFIYFRSIAISVNLLDKLVTVTCDIFLNTEIPLRIDQC